MTHPELHAEQRYIDNAYACLDRMREIVSRAGDAGVGEIAALALEAWGARRLRTFEDAERGLCFGRLTLENVASPVYIGRRWVHDDDQQALVVNWQAPAARPFYTATPGDPQRVTVRRRFRTQGRRLLDISDESLDGSGTGAALGDFLLEELERSRDTHMRDIVATIQDDQYRLITRDLDGVLVIQGGPGTGKTAVGLHRASYLLYTFRDRLRHARVLIVGPNPTFMEYVSHVLPSLGEESVEQRAVGELVDGAAPSGADPPAVARLKGDPRLAEVLSRAAELRQRPAPEDLYARLEGALVTVRAREVRELLEAARTELGLSALARERFRMNVLRRFYEHYGRILGGGAVRDFREIERALRAKGFLNRWLDRVWPFPGADALVRSVLTQRTRLDDAAEGVLSPEEQALLLRRSARGAWTDGDIPLLDEARALLAGTSPTFGHVIVDEAQDLTPMQLRMIARRAPSGSITILGDIAQGTGPVDYRDWEGLLPHLPHGDEAEVDELRYAYRVPREIMELALPLLERIAPEVEAPIAYRDGGRMPVLRRVGEAELLAEALREGARLGAEEGLLAVIAPEQLVTEAAEGLPQASAFEDGIPILTPRGAKGLEFDHVIVVEPALIAEEQHGLRGLYVALTRPTTTLVVVHSRPLPEPLFAYSGSPSEYSSGSSRPMKPMPRQ